MSNLKKEIKVYSQEVKRLNKIQGRMKGQESIVNAYSSHFGSIESMSTVVNEVARVNMMRVMNNSARLV